MWSQDFLDKSVTTVLGRQDIFEYLKNILQKSVKRLWSLRDFLEAK